jgi:nucleoside phosphorylase
VVETIFVPRGAEERAVRSAMPAGSKVRVVTMGIGPRAAARAADDALARAHFGTALITGLCGTLSPAFVVGDTLVYREIVSAHGPTVELDADLARALARLLPGGQTGIRAVASDRIVERSVDKYALGARYAASAVDMESYALASALARAGVAVGVVRVASDAVGDDLPELGRALDGSGGMDDFALALAFMRSPRAAARLIANATKSLRALSATVRALLATH